MSKTTNISRKEIRRRLLVTVSTAALLASAYNAGEADAADSARPLVWIEVGGQLEQMTNSQAQFAPSFVANIPDVLFSPLSVQKPSQYSMGRDASISFQPEGSDWILGASLRFGRAGGVKHKTQLIHNANVPVHITFPNFPTFDKYYSFYPSGHAKFEDVKSQQSESHFILDFDAGKDVGLGMFGSHASSILSAGVRIAHLTSRNTVTMHADPDVQYPTGYLGSKYARDAWKRSPIHLHEYAAMSNIQRDFRGIGPSVTWNASMPFAGDRDRGELTFDWGANGAVLFGRQKALGHHQTTKKSYYGNNWHAGAVGGGNYSGPLHPGLFFPVSGDLGLTHQSQRAANIHRTRAVVVPNLGGFAGFSFRYADAKISLGYRADFFFGAMDGGIDTRKSENRGFFGPYASISVGLGD